MREAAAVLVGRHDFASFQAGGGFVRDTTRALTRVELREAAGELQIEIDGDGFLRHMVRVIVGTLAEIGAGQRPVDDLPRVLAARDRRAAGQTAPACGLTLVSVKYGSSGAKPPGN
jgi:tRNA pseudouridine38-40 synthase